MRPPTQHPPTDLAELRLLLASATMHRRAMQDAMLSAAVASGRAHRTGEGIERATNRYADATERCHRAQRIEAILADHIDAMAGRS